MDLNWEAYKYLSRNALSEQELDAYYFLTYYYLKSESPNNFSAKLYDLIARATSENIAADNHMIKKHISNLTKKSRSFRP